MFSIIFAIGFSIVIVGNLVFQTAPSCNALSASESYSATQEEDADAIDIKDGKRTFVSSFIVNGVDLGAGYFYGSEPNNGFIRFISECGEESICYKVDSYTIDTSKQQVEDEKYMQAVREQINADPIWEGLFWSVVPMIFGIILLLAMLFFLSKLFE